jgi:LemA protein
MNLSLFTILLVLVGVLLVQLLYLWSTYNSFITKRNAVKTDFADIDVQIKRRASLIENLAHLVRDYAKHEKETFENVAKARSALDTSQTASDKAQANNMFSQTLRSLFAVVEKYPQLQASQNYQDLRTDLKEAENLIASYREQYNQTVREYNNLVQTFPNLLAARLFQFESEDLFQASGETGAPVLS